MTQHCLPSPLVSQGPRVLSELSLPQSHPPENGTSPFPNIPFLTVVQRRKVYVNAQYNS